MVDLRGLVSAFADEIGQTLASVVGEAAARMNVSIMGERFVITPEGDAPILLPMSDVPLLKLRVFYECSFDRDRRWPSVQKSEFHVFHVDDNEPLFRYQLRAMIRDAPETAAAALADLGCSVASPEEPVGDRVAALRRL